MKTRQTRGSSYREHLIPAISIILVSASSYLMKIVFPAPSEITDKAIVILWWMTPFFVVIWARKWIPLPRFLYKKRSGDCRRFTNFTDHRRTIIAIILASAVIFLIISIFSKSDSTQRYRGITLLDMAGGFGLLAAFYLFSFQARERFAQIFVAVTGILILLFALPAYVQWPGTMVDSFHFPFTSEEISAVATGHFPFSNFIPQYNAFLGYPLAPFLHIWHSNPPLVILAYLIFLQFLCIAILISLPALVSGWRNLPLAGMIGVFPPILLLNDSYRPVTYFADIPMRTTMPAIILLATFLWLRKLNNLGRNRIYLLVGIGAINGIAIMNNLDFGFPTLIAVSITIILTQETIQNKVYTFMLICFGVCLAFALFAGIALLSGNRIQGKYFLVFQKLFGVSNFLAMPIPAFGIHVAFAALFATTSAVGIAMLLRAPKPGSFMYREGSLLCLTGIFSLFSLVYYSGRSLVPSLLSGYAFQLGMCCAALVPLLPHRISAKKVKGLNAFNLVKLSNVFPVFALASVLAIPFMVGNPVKNLQAAIDGRTRLVFSDLVPYPNQRRVAVSSTILNSYVTEVEDIVRDPYAAGITPSLVKNSIWQILRMSNTIQLQTGVRSALLVNSPEYLALEVPTFRDLECKALAVNLDIQYLIADRVISQWLATNATCTSHFDIGVNSISSKGPDLVVLSRKFG